VVLKEMPLGYLTVPSMEQLRWQLFPNLGGYYQLLLNWTSSNSRIQMLSTQYEVPWTV